MWKFFGMKRLFKISSGEHGRGTVIVKWQPEGNLLATAGQNGEKRRKIRLSFHSVDVPKIRPSSLFLTKRGG